MIKMQDEQLEEHYCMMTKQVKDRSNHAEYPWPQEGQVMLAFA